MRIYERALELVPDGGVVGLGSGRAATAFVQTLAERMRTTGLKVRGVATSEATADLAQQVGIPLVSLAEAGILDIAIDGADEVDPALNLIKGYGRALVREKIVAASARQMVVLVGQEKIVPRLGTRGKLPIEVLEFAIPLCQRRLAALGCRPVPFLVHGRLFRSDNGNPILDCQIGPIDDPEKLERDLRAIPGVIGTGLFLGMAGRVLVGDRDTFELVEERVR
ncbi:MAG TPA: ribose-5-phosphate isomerase RpiA [Gemmataceae bacterium]|nr:ribose-5-phosphate isomerase RpiA [Gemmataceae bacterium]